jgi:hypothetical protein
LRIRSCNGKKAMRDEASLEQDDFSSNRHPALAL